MSDGARSFVSPGLTLVVGMLVGGLAGAYGTRVFDGDAPRAVDPSPAPVRECPPCADCPACPPPPECGDVSMIPSGEDPTLAPDPEDPRPPPDVPIEPAGPGLSARAIGAASAAVRTAIADCLQTDQADRASGMLLLELTVTATGGEGFITDALISQRAGATEAVEDCVELEAGRARFAHDGPDGEQRVKLPVKVGNY